MTMFGRALLSLIAVLLLWAAPVLAANAMSDAELISYQKAFQRALGRKDYDEAFRIALEVVEKETGRSTPAEADIAEAEFGIATLLLGTLELMAMEAGERAKEWYLPDEMAKLDRNERSRVGIVWMRRAAYHGSAKAIDELVRGYRRGLYGLYDPAIADCLEDAAAEASKLDTCRELEIIRGDVEDPAAAKPPVTRIGPQ